MMLRRRRKLSLWIEPAGIDRVLVIVYGLRKVRTFLMPRHPIQKLRERLWMAYTGWRIDRLKRQ